MIPLGLTQSGGEDDFTWDEVEEGGVALESLKDQDWFAFVGSAQQDGEGGMRMWTGQIVHKCLGSVLVQLDRNWDDRMWWAPETKVIRLPHPNEGKRVSLTEFCDD